MKKTIYAFTTAVLLVAGIMAGSGYAAENQKLAQTGFEFLSVVTDAKAAAMASAMTGNEAGSSSLFFNPAGMANMSATIDMTASLNDWIADIQHNAFSLAIRPFHGNLGVFGFSFQTVDYGEFYGTRVNKTLAEGYENTGTFSPQAMAIGGGYAKSLTDRFSVGGQVRWVRQRLGDSVIPIISTSAAGQDTMPKTVSNELTPLSFDFGTQFKTDIKSLVFGMSIRNFSKEIKYVEEGFQLPLTFNLGVSMNLMDFLESVPMNQALYMSIDAVHFRSHPEQMRIGLDYQVMNLLSLRGGYISSEDESNFSFGLGVFYAGVKLDYAYTPYGVFDKVQRMTARFSL